MLTRFQIQKYLSLNDQTLHLAVVYFDRVLSEVDFDEMEIELLGIACLLLASKIEEDLPIGAGLLLPLMDSFANSKVMLSLLEKEVVMALKFTKLRQTTAVTFLHYYSEIIGKSGKVVFRLARAILDVCLETVEGGDISPKMTNIVFTDLVRDSGPQSTGLYCLAGSQPAAG